MIHGVYPLCGYSPQISSTKGGTKVWHHNTQSWKVMARMITYLPPPTPEDILQLSLWWRMEYQSIFFCITTSRALTLYGKVLRYFRDIWGPGRYEVHNWEAAKGKLSHDKIYHDFWIKLLEFYGLSHDRMLNQQITQLTSQKWVGLYRSEDDTLPEWVVCTCYLKEFNMGPIQFNTDFMNTFMKSTVRP